MQIVADVWGNAVNVHLTPWQNLVGFLIGCPLWGLKSDGSGPPDMPEIEAYVCVSWQRYPVDSPTNQLAVSQVTDWSVFSLDN